MPPEERAPGGQPPADGEAPLTIEVVCGRTKDDGEALLSDPILDFAVGLDDVAFERLRKRLSAHVRTPDLQSFVRAVKARRTEQRETKSKRRPATDDRPAIRITVEEGDVNDQAAAALGRIPGLYSRMGELVRVVETTRRKPGELHPYTTTAIRMVTDPLLREYLARAARWIETGEDGEDKPAHPPEWCVKNLPSRYNWAAVPPLYYAAESPVLLPDGRILQDVGYDAATGILCNTKITVDVPEQLTRDDARAAVARILDLTCDVRSFENESHRSAWLAAMFTVIARWAFSGQCPLFMFDTNKPGVGKNLLIGVISAVALGRPCDYTIQTADEDEERKFITSKIVTGQPMVFIDECEKPFGSGPMQGLLTTGTWAPRLLGTNDSPSFDASTVWIAAGVNVQFKSSDILRRCAVIRIVTDLDKPEERTEFKYDLERDVAANRAAIFCDVLVAIRAWLTSGLQVTDLEGWGGRWGSFDDWDRVVRGAIVFAGAADPIGAKATRTAPNVKEGIADLVLGLEEIVASMGGEGSASAIHAALDDNDAKRKEARAAFGLNITPPAVNFQLFRKGLHSLMPHLKGATPSANQLGTALGRNQEQAVPSPAGRKWIKYRHSDGGLWRVDTVPDAPAKTMLDDLVAKLKAQEAPCEVCGLPRGTGPNKCDPCSRCRKCIAQAPFHHDGCHC